jgi:uncharacterized protein (TIGR02246 family)
MGEGTVRDEDQIRRTLSEYSQRFDDGQFDEWADLFTEDAQLVVTGQVTEGRAAIRHYMVTVQSAGSRGMHVTTNSLVDVDGDSATASTDYMYVRPGEKGHTIIAAGRYHDQLVRTRERWRFRVREITMLTAPDRAPDG